jgi:hypothetical protein
LLESTKHVYLKNPKKIAARARKANIVICNLTRHVSTLPVDRDDCTRLDLLHFAGYINDKEICSESETLRLTATISWCSSKLDIAAQLAPKQNKDHDNNDRRHRGSSLNYYSAGDWLNILFSAVNP